MKIAEFDQFADEYYQAHKDSIGASGEAPEYFARCKAADLRATCTRLGVKAKKILDFGSGVGNSIPYLREMFPEATLTCADVSRRSIDIAQQRYPGPEAYALIEGEKLPLDDNAFDVAFSACVFHHIDHKEHDHWLRELLRAVRPGGLLFIYEHNPYNPLTLSVVNSCIFDKNAHLIACGIFRHRASAAGWRAPEISYRVFFPKALEALRPFEDRLTWLPLGAQYFLAARKPAA